jgi:hypothetical protein
MGTWRVLGTAVLVASLLRAAPVAAGTLVEPIARLTLEGGYDSNALYDGQSGDAVGRVSPEIGFRLRDPLWDLRTTYGGELVYYPRLAPGGAWNHRGGFALDARPTRRTALSAGLGISQAFDPTALARAGVFRIGRQQAVVVGGRARLDWRAEETLGAAATLDERLVSFQDGSGGAMHRPTLEVMERLERRLALGGAYAFGVFQSFEPGAAPDRIAYAHALRARGRWQAERHLTINAWAGPALWLPAGSAAVIPELFAEALYATRGFDLRLNAGHQLGIGATAQPGIVDSAEFGAGWRLGRTWFVRGDGGVWRSGEAPSARGAVTGYAVAGEAGMILRGGLRMSVTGAHFGRVDFAEPRYRRTAVGLRMGWEYEAR